MVKKRHKWIEEGGKNKTFCYTCADCGAEKIKRDFCSAQYRGAEGGIYTQKVPECITNVKK